MRKFRLFAVAVLTGLLAGCSNTATFDYASSQGTMARFREAGAAKKTVAVLPVMDQRGIQTDPSAEPGEEGGSFYLGFIPLFPFGYVIKPEPEKSDDFVSLGYFHFDPQNDLANAEFMSLKTSNLFAEVTRASNLLRAETDYIWRSAVTNTCYRGKFLTYGLTYFGALPLWIIGIPSGVSSNELGMRFELVERASGKTVWQYEYNGSDFILHWIYARIGEDTIWYPRLMKQAMNQALADLAKKDQL